MNFTRRIAVALGTATLGTAGLIGIVNTAASAATIPGTVNEVVSPTGSLTDPGCPSGLTSTNGVYTNLASAQNAADPSDTIYVCAGSYDFSGSAYSSSESVDVNTTGLTIDGYDWNSAPSGSWTGTSNVNSSTQSVIENGDGIQVSADDVTIQGFTFETNNGGTLCSSSACNSSIVAPSGQNGLVVKNNFFVGTGGGVENSVVNLGNSENSSNPGDSTSAEQVSTLNTGDEIENNVFAVLSGSENNQVVMSATTGAVVSSNTVNYPSADSSSLSALWFPGFDQATTVDNNTLNGGNIPSTSGYTSDPKSGIKFVDEDSSSEYGNGCTAQTISGNTITGFQYDISMISQGIDVSPGGTGSPLCGAGPSNFSVTNNTVSHALGIGIYIDGDTGETAGTISGNAATSDGTDDYVDTDSPIWTWSNNTGTGGTNPSGIGETAPTTTTTSTTTSTTVAPTTTTVPASSTTTTIPKTSTTTTTSTTTSTTSTTSTTTTLAPSPALAPKPTVFASVIAARSGAVEATVHCAQATCKGLVELTKRFELKVRTGASKRFHLRSFVLRLGYTHYALRAGTSEAVTVRLNKVGRAAFAAAKQRGFRCTLTINTRSGTLRRSVYIATKRH